MDPQLEQPGYIWLPNLSAELKMVLFFEATFALTTAEFAGTVGMLETGSHKLCLEHNISNLTAFRGLGKVEPLTMNKNMNKSPKVAQISNIKPTQNNAFCSFW